MRQGGIYLLTVGTDGTVEMAQGRRERQKNGNKAFPWFTA